MCAQYITLTFYSKRLTHTHTHTHTHNAHMHTHSCTQHTLVHTLALCHPHTQLLRELWSGGAFVDTGREGLGVLALYPRLTTTQARCCCCFCGAWSHTVCCQLSYLLGKTLRIQCLPAILFTGEDSEDPVSYLPFQSCCCVNTRVVGFICQPHIFLSCQFHFAALGFGLHVVCCCMLLVDNWHTTLNFNLNLEQCLRII